MNMLKWLPILIFFTSCNSSDELKKQYVEFEYAVYENEPVFEDAFLFPSQSKKAMVDESEIFDIYIIDWNQNGNYGDKNEDYIGVKSPLDRKPNLSMIADTNCIKYNGDLYDVMLVDSGIKISESVSNKSSELSLIDKYIPLVMADDQILNLTFEKDSTMIYFWATWCAPCVQTLKEIGPRMKELNAKGIDIIPVAYNCSDSRDFLLKHDLPFENHVLSESTATLYSVYGLPEKFTFLKDGRMASSNINLRRFYAK